MALPSIDWFLATRQRMTVSALVLLGILLLGAVLWYSLMSPLTGTISATNIGTDGSVRAVAVSVKNLSRSYYSYPRDIRVALLAAVPSPQGDSLAYMTRSKDGTMRVLVGQPGTTQLKEIVEGSLSTPRWSGEGLSIAVARRDGEAHAPDAWTVLRAVKNGDSLSVGRGYKPYPSPNQRTFALSSEGIVLLSYADTEPNVVVASPVPVPESTPFTVSQDGMRVAWVAPADQSLQVFENVNGYFVPLLLKPNFSANSLVFSPTGRHLMTSESTGATSTLRLITVSGGSVSEVGEVPGFLDLHTWIYEN